MRPEAFHAGDRTELLTFQIQLFTEDSEGRPVGRWVDSFKEYADVERSNETTATFKTEYLERLTRRTPPDDDPPQKKYRIIYDGAYWQIRDVIHDRNRRATMIESDFSMMVEVTNLDSDAQREFIVGLPLVHP